MNEFMNQLGNAGISVSLKVSSFRGCEPAGEAKKEIRQNGSLMLAADQASWRCSLAMTAAVNGDIDAEATFVVESGSEPCGNAAVVLDFQDWSADNDVFMPAAVYQGNRFRTVAAKYPPFLHEEDGIGPDMPVTITDVPHLNPGEGFSQIHLRSGDMATPCAGVFMPVRSSGFLLLFESATPFGYTGVKLTEAPDRLSARLELEAPAVRRKKYTMMRSGSPSDDRGAAFRQGDRICLRFRLVLFECPDVSTLFKAFFDRRKLMAAAARSPHSVPFSAAYRIIEQKYNHTQWNREYGYYMDGPESEDTIYSDWQAGWCGGGMNSLALLYDGLPLSQERADRTMDAIFGILQTPKGYIQPVFWQGKPLGDDFCHTERSTVLLIRKDADVLVFASRHILLKQRRNQEVSGTWLSGLRALAAAFVRLWKRYGQFGQFIDADTDEILQGGTACGSMAPGGLALAWQVLKDDEFLQTAESSARYYHERYVQTGLLNGGPGEILQNSDSESASNMLESFIILYETTGNRAYVSMAEEAARICASWQVSYDFIFPADSAFGKLGIHTLGSIYANVQNKHSAPGFCTLSGASLLRLFRATGDRRYLEMCRETAHGITQYLSRADRPIPAWDGRMLPAGWMCERVNMSDWEGKEHVGGVFYGSCWCEISCMLTYAEIPGVLFLSDTGEAITIDHIDAAVADAGDTWRLTLSNPTSFDAEVKLLVEPRLLFAVPWDPCVTDSCQVVRVPAKAAVDLPLPKDKDHATPI
ncbi:MAG: hypothetical protein VB070_11035 [Clostridiaceae bacterium]|nr:hypothetical protein [Clostridiaceae bacterium]